MEKQNKWKDYFFLIILVSTALAVGLVILESTGLITI